MRSQLQVAFGKAVRSRRELLSLSREELAEKSGLPFRSICGIERGERNVSLTQIMTIAVALDSNPAALLAQTTLRPR